MTEVMKTERLVLRSLELGDAEPISRMAADRAIADTMISVPHPFTLDDALGWIAASGQPREHDVPHRYFGICLAVGGELVGITALRHIETDHGQAELSFWIGRAYWGQGLAVEAGRALLVYAFDVLALNRVEAYHMGRNPASGRVLSRLGFRQEGVLRERVRKWGTFEDVVVCSLLRSEHLAPDQA